MVATTASLFIVKVPDTQKGFIVKIDNFAKKVVIFLTTTKGFVVKLSNIAKRLVLKVLIVAKG